MDRRRYSISTGTEDVYSALFIPSCKRFWYYNHWVGRGEFTDCVIDSNTYDNGLFIIPHNWVAG